MINLLIERRVKIANGFRSQVETYVQTLCLPELCQWFPLTYRFDFPNIKKPSVISGKMDIESADFDRFFTIIPIDFQRISWQWNWNWKFENENRINKTDSSYWFRETLGIEIEIGQWKIGERNKNSNGNKNLTMSSNNKRFWWCNKQIRWISNWDVTRLFVLLFKLRFLFAIQFTFSIIQRQFDLWNAELDSEHRDVLLICLHSTANL